MTVQRNAMMGLACGVIILGAAAAQGGWVGYDPQTNEMPDGTWSLVDAGEFITSVSSGIANITTTNSPNLGKYQKDTGFDAATGYTVDIRVK